jgi:hypothetical protein
MSAQDRQSQTIRELIQGSPVKLRVDSEFPVGDQRPENRLYSLACECGGLIRIMFDQGKDAEWATTAQEKLTQHIQSAHK